MSKKDRPPWITEDGYIDPAKIPMDYTLRETVSSSAEDFWAPLSVLQTMHRHGRQEAGIYLLGLLVNCDDDWEKRCQIIKALERFNTKGCANLLFSELKRVKGSNTTRRYINAILNVLTSMPLELIEPGFEELKRDKSFTYRRHHQFEEILWEARGRKQKRTECEK